MSGQAEQARRQRAVSTVARGMAKRIEKLQTALSEVRRCNGQGADGSYGCTHCYDLADKALG